MKTADMNSNLAQYTSYQAGWWDRWAGRSRWSAPYGWWQWIRRWRWRRGWNDMDRELKQKQSSNGYANRAS